MDSLSSPKALSTHTIPKPNIPAAKPTLNNVYPICIEAVCIDKGGKINAINTPIKIAHTKLMYTLKGSKYTISVTIGAKQVPNKAV